MTFTMDRISGLKTLKALPVTSQVLLGTLIFLVLIWIVKFFLSRPKRLNFPVIEASPTDYKSALLEGTLKYPDTPFIIGDIVILPASTLDEVRNLPENRVSFTKMIEKTMQAKHTGLAVENPEIIKAVKVDLTRHITSNLDGLQDEIRYGFDKELGPCEDWTPVYLYYKLARIIALMSGRVFVGLPLSREEEWIDATVNYTRDVMLAREAIIAKPPIIRDLIARFLPAVRSVKRYGERGAVFLAPLIKEILAREANGKTFEPSPEEESRGTMVAWMLKYAKYRSVRTIADAQMSLSFAAIFTTTSTVSQAIFDLVSRPEYIQPLRDEIQRVVDDDGYDDVAGMTRKLKKQSIPKLRKLDSFLKESQRFSPPGFASLDRLTTAPLKLSTGHMVPKGVHIAFPSYSISLSAQSMAVASTDDSNSLAPPHEFDGFRFDKLRAMQGKESKYQFVTTSHDSLHFGHGIHACPGRFFASNEIKVVLIELLQNWDIRLKGDVKGVGGVEKRPESRQFEMGCSPNESAEIEFRRRKH